MRRGSSIALVLASFLAFRPTNAQPAVEGVVARVGTADAVTSASLAARIAAMPPFQRAAFGRTGPEVARRYLEDVVVPERLVEAAARSDRLAEKPAVALAVDRVLSGATVRAVRARVGSPSTVAADEVRAYYEANRARYDAPERYKVARVLCRTRDEALAVIAAARADSTPKAIAALAREHSQDKGTNLRGGDLGFVTEDGTSDEPGLKVDPAVVRAARSVADGELVPQPVAEGDLFAVVWRRGTIAARKHTADDVAPEIRDAVAKARVKEETDRLLAALHASRVRDENASLLDGLELPGLAPPAPPSTLDAQAGQGSN
jgi:peptidyl-prolyl cis-trans isomerase C